MKQAILLLVVVIAVLEFGGALIGAEAMLSLAFGATALMALMIAGTFLWLWAARATPLALGMALSWAGFGLLTGAWWLGGMTFDRLSIVMSLALSGALSGAILHLAVIHRSLGRHGAGFLWPVGLAFGVSVLVQSLS